MSLIVPTSKTYSRYTKNKRNQIIVQQKVIISQKEQGKKKQQRSLNKMAIASSYLLIITLSVNELLFPIKRQSDWIDK